MEVSPQPHHHPESPAQTCRSQTRPAQGCASFEAQLRTAAQRLEDIVDEELRPDLHASRGPIPPASSSSQLTMDSPAKPAEVLERLVQVDHHDERLLLEVDLDHQEELHELHAVQEESGVVPELHHLLHLNTLARVELPSHRQRPWYLRKKSL